MKINNERYPIEKVKGSDKKYDEKKYEIECWRYDNMQNSSQQKKKIDNEKFSEELLLSLLETNYNMLLGYDSLRPVYLATFLSTIFIVIGGSFAVLASDIDEIGKYSIMIICSVFAILITTVMKKMLRRNYEHTKEYIGKIAILQDNLGITDINKYKHTKYFIKDTLVLDEHMDSRTKPENETFHKFVKNKKNGEMMKNIGILCWFIYAMGASIIGYSIYEIVIFIIRA